MAILVKNRDAIKDRIGQVVEIRGIYREINGAKRRGQFSPSGRASIRLEDGHSIVLEYQDKGYRPEAELKTMQDQTVKAIGTYIGMQTLWGDGTVASIVAEVLEDIQQLELIAD